MKRYYENKEIEFEKKKERYKNDSSFRLKYSISNRIRKVLNSNSKSAKTLDLLGCSVEELKTHLEKQFKEGMTWDNYGFKGWHMDHIKPCASFDLKNPEEQKECFHYTNLQPLWWYENFSKSDKF